MQSYLSAFRGVRVWRRALVVLAAVLLQAMLDASVCAQPCTGCSNLIPPGLQIVDCRENENGSTPVNIVGAAAPGGVSTEIRHGNLFPGGITVTHVCVRLKSPTGQPGEPARVTIYDIDPTNFNLPGNLTYQENFTISPSATNFQLVQLSIPQPQTALFWVCVEYPTAMAGVTHQYVSPRTQNDSAIFIDWPTLGWDYYDNTGAASYVGFAPIIRALELAPLPPEACCFPDGSCQSLSPPQCTGLGGVPQGPLTDCTTVTCPGPGTCAPGAKLEPEACGGDINGGCNSNPPTFTPVQCGDLYCSTAWANNGNRDTDWYEINLRDGDGDGFAELTVDMTATLPMVTFIFHDTCTTLPILASGEADSTMDAHVTICLPAPATYWVFAAPGTLAQGIFAGYPCGTTNDYTMLFTCNEPCANPPQFNDTCAMATPVICGSVTSGNTTNATTSPLLPCAAVSHVDGDLWYHLVGTGGPIEAHLCDPGTLVNHAITIYHGPCAALQCMDASTSDVLGICGGNPNTSIAFPTIPGDDYYIVVHPLAPGQTGDFVLHVDCPGLPANDDCSNALQLLPGSYTWDNCGATTDGPFEPCGFSGMQNLDHDIWFEFVMPCDGSWLVELPGALFEQLLAVYTQCPQAGGFVLSCHGPPAGAPAIVSGNGIAGETFWIRIGGRNGQCSIGSVDLTISCNPVCPPDCVTSATFQPPPDGIVDGADLAVLLGDWSPSACGANCCSDTVTSATFLPPPDGIVNGADLAVLLGAWGNPGCPNGFP